MTLVNLKAKAFIAMTGALVGTSAIAQGTVPVQAPPSLSVSISEQRAFPNAFGVPTAVAARSGTGFVGATLVNPRSGISGEDWDGDLVAGYSLGNPIDALSLTFGVALTGIDPLGDAGSFSLSASRLLRAGGNSATFIGGSASNLLPWGVNKDRSEAVSLYLSHLVGIKSGSGEIPVQFTVGYGSDVTRSSDGLGNLSDGAFVGIGVGLSETLSGSISATETQINLGMTYTHPGSSVSATLGVLDVGNNTDRRQLSLSIGYGF